MKKADNTIKDQGIGKRDFTCQFYHPPEKISRLAAKFSLSLTLHSLCQDFFKTKLPEEWLHNST